MVVEEESGEDLLRISFYQAVKKAQVAVRALQWRADSNNKNRVNNPDGTPKYALGDPTRAWHNQQFRLTGFLSQSRTIMGTSDETMDGDVLFSSTNPSDKPPGRIVEFQGRCDEQDKIPVTISRVDGPSRRISIQCGFLTRYIRRHLVQTPART